MSLALSDEQVDRAYAYWRLARAKWSRRKRRKAAEAAAREASVRLKMQERPAFASDLPVGSVVRNVGNTSYVYNPYAQSKPTEDQTYQRMLDMRNVARETLYPSIAELPLYRVDPICRTLSVMTPDGEKEMTQSEYEQWRHGPIGQR